jgi:hypothetical protein
MEPDTNLTENGLLIVTGSSLRAEQADRPLAYRLKSGFEEHFNQQQREHPVIVLSDLWYLNSETLQRLPVVSVGGPGVNALSAHLYHRLSNALVIDNTLVIQMDIELQNLRASIWGMDHQTTVDALDIFVKRGYLERFLGAMAARSC